jgi:hypothetical protein
MIAVESPFTPQPMTAYRLGAARLDFAGRGGE